MMVESAKLEKIEQIFRNFLLNRIKTIRKLKIADLDINPFLIRLFSHEMSLDNSEAIVRWLVSQRLERGSVTSFGIALQEAAKTFSEGTGVEGADILKTRNEIRHHIQVKSGPNTVPKDLGVRIAQLLRSAQRRNRGSVAIYAMCYGNKARISSIVRRYVQSEGGIDLISGREFWEFISNDPQLVDKIYTIAAEIGKTFRGPQGQSLSEVVEGKIQELTAEFEKIYGKSGTDMWVKLLEYNS